MAELAVSVLVEAAKPMVEAVVGRMREEIHLFWGFEKELKKLQRKVVIIESMVVDGISDNSNLESDKALKIWMSRILRIIYDADDMLDVLAYEKHRGVVMKRSRRKRFIFWPLKQASLRSKMGSWIRRINTDIQDALKEAETIVQLKELAQLASSSSHPATRRMNHNNNNYQLEQLRRHVDMSIFVGRDSDVRSVVDMLCKPPHHSHHLTTSRRLSVVAIVGIGGMGKTSLAKQVSENETVITHFAERIWIPDLKIFDIDKILNKMVEHLGKGNYGNYSPETAIRKLEEYLGGKRYLLVLDDVWNKDAQCWDSMRYKLESIGGSMESKVLVTTRDDAVAEAMHAFSVHPLSGLSKDDSWSLFQQIAFANKSNRDVSALEASGRKIVEKCKGVPLAIKSIGGLLHRKRNPHEWTVIEKSELWDIPHHEIGILPSLKLSYDYLSSPLLKKCFSLCAFLPKGYYFDQYDLVDKWIALGLIQKSNNENITLEDIGDEYLDELLSISFLFVEQRNEVGEANLFFMHDLVYDLARSVATHERLYLEAGKKVNNVLHIRHITVDAHAEMTPDFPDKLVLRKIHSLDTLGKLPRGLLKHVKYLRVLHLELSNVEELPEMVAGLKCLKYLNLAKNPIKVLPECIMELYNLQSLILYRCNQLLGFPGGLISNLVNLRHLGLSFDFRPAEGVIQQLSQLHTLPPLQLSEGGFQISELGSLHHIRGNLEIKGLELIKSKLIAEKANLSNKPRVEQLRLSWDNGDNCTNCEEVLDGLCPHPNLKLLSINGYAGDKFPSWLTRMNSSPGCNNEYAVTVCHLIKIELIDCGRCQHLPTLGHLGSLKMLVIRGMENVKQIGPEFYCGADMDLLRSYETQASSSCSSAMVKSGSGVYFKSLKELELRHLCNLEEWCEPGGGGFPSLEKLVIEECPELKRMPNHFPHLAELTVKEITSSHPLMSIMTNTKRSLSCLKKLHIERVFELTHLPEELGACTSLQTLFIRDCQKLSSLPENLSKLLSLEKLQILKCRNLESLPNLSGLVSLRQFRLIDNDGLRGVPEGLRSCHLLQDLLIKDCERVETLPDLAGLSHLSNLCILGMPKIRRYPPNWLCSLPCLRDLHIGDYRELNEFPDWSLLLKITSLKSLHLTGWRQLQSFPEQLQCHFTKLRELSIRDFENMEHLPDWIGHLSSLRRLFLVRCYKLRKLPSKAAMERLTNLVSLVIIDCPFLKEAIEINGPEHHKIAAARFHVHIIVK